MTGKRYQYREDGYVANVTVIEDRSDREWDRYLLRLDTPMGDSYDTGDEFEVSWNKGYPNILWKMVPLA